MTEALHSKFGASASAMWLACAGSLPLSRGKPNRGSVHSATGTVAHTLFEHAIKTRSPVVPKELIGRAHKVDNFRVTVDEDMAAAVDTALEHVWELMGDADIIESEARVNYAHWIEVPEADGFGTLDLSAYWIEKRHLAIGDYKHGQGVEVDATDNSQLMLYAGAKMSELEAVGFDVDTISFYIFQPRVRSAPSEWSMSAQALRDWLRGRARSGAQSVLNAERAFPDASSGALDEWQEVFLTPGEKQCRWCKAKATCPALRGLVTESVFDTKPATPDEFEDLTQRAPEHASDAKWLSAALAKADLIEDWVKAVRAEVESLLIAGTQVPGFKLVEGKLGNRAWGDADAAEQMLKTFRLKQEEMYDFKLISPTAAEKLAKAETIGKRQWPKLQELITRAPGKKHVAPESDPRPALTITPVVDFFDDVSQLV